MSEERCHHDRHQVPDSRAVDVHPCSRRGRRCRAAKFFAIGERAWRQSELRSQATAAPRGRWTCRCSFRTLHTQVVKRMLCNRYAAAEVKFFYDFRFKKVYAVSGLIL